MNISTSECSSGCESGWTTYLDQLSNSTNPYKKQNYQEKRGNVNNDDDDDDDDDDEEDEDLSMVSDASSGPPNLHENYGVDYGSEEKKKKKKSKQKSKTKETKVKKNQSLCLDDTASSPFLHFSQENAVSPENHNSNSTAHFEEENASKKNAGFFKSSTKGKSGSFLGRKRQ